MDAVDLDLDISNAEVWVESLREIISKDDSPHKLILQTELFLAENWLRAAKQARELYKGE